MSARHGKFIKALVVLLAAVTLALGVSGCGKSNAGAANSTASTASFLGQASNAVFFIQWTRTDNSLNGSVYETILKDTSGSGVDIEQFAFSGTISGDGLTLQLTPSLGNATSLVGQLLDSGGFTLTIQGQNAQLITVFFTPGQISDYNEAVRSLKVSQYGSPCTLFVQGHDAVLKITGPNAASHCESLVNDWKSDAPLTTVSQGGSSYSLSQVCDLVSGTDEAIVYDDGGQSYGRSICSALSKEGWTPRSASQQSRTVVAPSQSNSLPTNIGECSITSVTSIGSRLKGVPNSGIAIKYSNGGFQVSYETPAWVRDWQVGDQVQLCLVSIPENCPPGDNRGRFYDATNLRTNETWEAMDSQHKCGGA